MEPIDRIVEGQLLNDLTDQPIMESADFVTAVNSSRASHQFATSRSMTPTVYESMQHVADISATALTVMGCGPDDAVLNLLAPRPHLSGVAAKKGARTLGTTMHNLHFNDFIKVIEEGHGGNITIVTSIPSIVLQKGREIAQGYGEVPQVFPNLKRAFLGGEPVRSMHRTATKTMWGVDSVHEFYGSSEVSLIAVGPDESRRLVPLLNHLIIELYDGEQIIDIRDIETIQTGELLITDPNREAINLCRYRQGDRIRVYPDPDIPRIEPLGRADDAIDLDGALVHPTDLFDAIEAADLTVEESYVDVEDKEYPTTLTIYATTNGTFDDQAFKNTLLDANPALVNVIEDDTQSRIDVKLVNSSSEIPVDTRHELSDSQIWFESREKR